MVSSMLACPRLLLWFAAVTSLSCAEPSEFFPADSRLWKDAGKAVVLSDFSTVEPASALTKGPREKGKWKLIPFATAELQGMALSCYSQTAPAPVRLPLAARAQMGRRPQRECGKRPHHLGRGG